MSSIELVCFHHAGGGAATFHPLRRALTELGADVALTTVTLPGRDSRSGEPRHVDADACVRGLADELEDLLNRPHVFLGYSMGAILAYALTCRRLSQGLRAPHAVIVAAYRAPGVSGPMEDLDLDDDDALIGELARHGGIPAEILFRREWLELLIPIVRDDLRICQSYSPAAGPPLPCPLYAFGGREDPLAPPESLDGWASHSAQPQPVKVFAGDHFLFRDPGPELVREIARIIEDAGAEE